MKLLTLAGLLIGTAAYASPAAPKMYDLELKVEKDGKLLSAPRLSVIEGETATVTETNDQGCSFVEGIAKEQKKNKESDRGQVLVQLTVGGIDAKGKKTVYGTPQIVALENEPASMTIGSSRKLGKGAKKDTAKNELSVSVTARTEN